MIDALQQRIHPLVKWCLAGMGAVGGWNYAQEHASSIPASCIVAGAAAGFCLLFLGFASLRVLKALGILAVVLVIANYAVLIPYGYGDHMPGWIEGGKAAMHWLDPSPLFENWGSEIRPPRR